MKRKLEELKDIQKLHDENRLRIEEDRQMRIKNLEHFSKIEAKNALIASNSFTISIVNPSEDSMNMRVIRPLSIEVSKGGSKSAFYKVCKIVVDEEREFKFKGV